MLKELSLRAQTLPQALEITQHSIHDVQSDSIKSDGNSDVYRARFGITPVALKFLRVMTTGGADEAQKKLFTALTREALMWRYVRHPNLLPFLGYCPDLEGRPCLVTEWMSQGTLDKFLQEYPEDANRRQLVCSWVFWPRIVD
jgi:hypothetical protein